MIVGPWLGWPWFLFNGHAVGSNTRVRELVYIVLAAAGIPLFFLGIGALVALDIIVDGNLLYMHLVLFVWTMIFGYALHITQNRAVSLFRYFNGPPAPGYLVVISGLFCDSYVEAFLRTAGGGWARVVLG